MKTLLKLGEMIQYLPTEVKDAINHVAKETGNKTDSLELHRHGHSEKAAVNGLDPKSRCALKYVSARTQDRDDEIVIPEVIQLGPFRKYMHVLFNHNYSLPPIGSDRTIEADEFGIKAMTEYADTGVGTMANVMWALVSQGHQKASSIGFVPTSFTKPGARDWDHVANQLQSNWKEFDKVRAEKSISRIITGGVLLEHSDVTVPCNVDAGMVQVLKALHPDNKVLKQFGWEMKDGIIVNKAAAPDPVSCVCDECGYVETVVPGSKCPECKTGNMKPKAKEKAIEIREPKKIADLVAEIKMREDLTFTEQELRFALDNKGRLPTPDELKAYKYVEKALPLPCTCDECGAEAECAPGSACQEPDCDGTMVADKGKKKAYYAACVCDECGAEADTNPGEACSEDGCKGKMQLKKKAEKAVTEIKVVRPAPSVKVLFVPPSGSEIAQRVGEAVEKALSRRTGKIM